jgi:NAD(P)-dependent dehydrogenase (short-subunit alcohol dehydrogenase family)
MRFTDAVAVVTGGAHGIGRATVENLLNDGARVAVFDVDRDAAESTRRELDATGGRVSAFECDVLDPASVDRAVDAAVREFGRIDILASVAGGDTAVDDPLDEEHWNRIVSLNLHGPARMIRACLPHLKVTRGVVVLVGSVNGLVAFGEPAYSSAKAGLSLLARNLAVTLGPDGIRINVVAPGTVRTRVWDTQPGALEKLRGNYPLGRVGEPSDIAAAIAFLASSVASWITGVTLPVDGGGTAGPLTSLIRDS